jgi:putative Ca2+/H+ antiporter (TMEM165/GDT1 family)
MGAFLQSLVLITVAEMGDKTQLVSLAFAARYPTRTVLAGIFVATLLVHLFSVAIGEFLGLAIPQFWVSLAAGLAFIGFGLWTLRGDKIDDEETAGRGRFGPFFTVAITFFLAELGDKTMLMTVALASQHHAFVPVWLGSTIGMVIADGMAVIFARVVGRRLPERVIRIGAAIIFIVAGVAILFETLRGG